MDHFPPVMHRCHGFMSPQRIIIGCSLYGSCLIIPCHIRTPSAGTLCHIPITPYLIQDMQHPALAWTLTLCNFSGSLAAASSGTYWPLLVSDLQTGMHEVSHPVEVLMAMVLLQRSLLTFVDLGLRFHSSIHRGCCLRCYRTIVCYCQVRPRCLHIAHLPLCYSHNLTALCSATPECHSSLPPFGEGSLHHIGDSVSQCQYH